MIVWDVWDPKSRRNKWKDHGVHRSTTPNVSPYWLTDQRFCIPCQILFVNSFQHVFIVGCWFHICDSQRFGLTTLCYVLVFPYVSMLLASTFKKWVS